MSQDIPATDAEAKLRRVRYERWGGMRSSWKPTENSLLAFVYDPYVSVDACGVFPPFHILSQILLRGGGGGGMGPGARWEPFSLSREEHNLLVDAIRTVPPSAIEGLTGLTPLRFIFDPAFDGPPETYPVRRAPKRWEQRCPIPPEYKESVEWMGAVCAKHRDRWHAEKKTCRPNELTDHSACDNPPLERTAAAAESFLCVRAPPRPLNGLTSSRYAPC